MTRLKSRLSRLKILPYQVRAFTYPLNLQLPYPPKTMRLLPWLGLFDLMSGFRHILLASSTISSTTNNPHQNPSNNDLEARLLLTKRLHIACISLLPGYCSWNLPVFVFLHLRSSLSGVVFILFSHLLHVIRLSFVVLRKPKARTGPLWPLSCSYIGLLHPQKPPWQDYTLLKSVRHHGSITQHYFIYTPEPDAL